MFGEKVIELLKESERNRDTIDQYNVSYFLNQIFRFKIFWFSMHRNDYADLRSRCCLSLSLLSDDAIVKYCQG